MGKNYNFEMGLLDATYQTALGQNVEKITEFISSNSGKKIYSAGSGGSLAFAEYVSLLTDCIADTPYGVAQRNLDKNYAVMLVSASGNNSDVVSLGEKCIRNNVDAIGIVANLNSKLSKIVDCFQVQLNRDGFLATNTLLAGIAWVAKACNVDMPARLPEYKKQNLRLANNEFVLIHDRWGKPAAVDIESRCIEAGLCNIIVSDYRNFGHGRYTWLNQYPETEVVALVTPHCVRMEQSTTNLLDRPVKTISTSLRGCAGSMELVYHMMNLAGEIGKNKNRDPGMVKNKTCKGLYRLDIGNLIE